MLCLIVLFILYISLYLCKYYRCLSKLLAHISSVCFIFLNHSSFILFLSVYPVCCNFQVTCITILLRSGCIIPNWLALKSNSLTFLPRELNQLLNISLRISLSHNKEYFQHTLKPSMIN